MIPLKLSLTNFLSYRETAVLDFAGLHLACIAGLNGAGKSSILDGMTWALFGQSRSRSDDDVVNRLAARSDETAEVILDFELEGVVYRIVRRKRSGRAMQVEFQVASDYENEQWKALTGAGRRETDQEIIDLLRMNYDTFANASFLLQGKADEFTTKTAGKRKEVLADLLGVNRWDRYRETAAGRRKTAEGQVAILDAQIGDIALELAEEPSRKEAFARAKADYELVAQQLAAQEKLLEQARRAEETIRRQRTAVEQAAAGLAREERRLADWRKRREIQQSEREQAAAILADAAEITARTAAWEAAQKTAADLQTQADEHNRLKQAMQPYEVAIEREKSQLQTSERALRLQKQRVAALDGEKKQIDGRLAEIARELERLAAQLAEQTAAAEEAQRLQNERSELEGQRPLLKEQMDKLVERIEQLTASTGGTCPVCGQPLTDDHRDEVVAELQADGKGKGDQFRAIKSRLPEIERELQRLDTSLKQRVQLEQAREKLQREETRLQGERGRIEETAREWAEEGSRQLEQIQKRLTSGDILPEAQQTLADLTAELAQVGYDPQAHAAARAELAGLADAPRRQQALEQAQARVELLDKSLTELAGEITQQETVVAEQARQHEAAREALQALTGGEEAADLARLERETQRLRETEITANRQVGRAEQLLKALDDQRARQAALAEERATLTLRIQRLKLLEKACGRDGVQALLIEQALPEIEDAANRLLNRLTDGQMQVTFETQRQLKSRDATAETLDIHIADMVGIRPYENFSGGEQFRVNFAIRIALSQILAKRAGARLQTLVIDEGFGSQDPAGRQRLIEAINAIQDDFKRVLIITHIDELRDAFPNRIEVVKTPQGSQIAVT